VISDAYHQTRIDTSGILLPVKEYLALLFHRQAGRTKATRIKRQEFQNLKQKHHVAFPNGDL
jgi:hypothetical protein